ncbi:hypothetical protein K432DRAFT_210245 [Lepidopterella palustris CBS 459.81]|uniref:Uncharacterized protein n=1 Tax=Lepidopterella palustris CBS 459.81 TaxID=1314670 RepID=A0A8E2J9D1_9PEZI|nr:hypothetical protein K432DRAFT_210245 [Lepidopterella palustris CBS 459.81]
MTTLKSSWPSQGLFTESTRRGIHFFSYVLKALLHNPFFDIGVLTLQAREKPHSLTTRFRHHHHKIRQGTKGGVLQGAPVAFIKAFQIRHSGSSLAPWQTASPKILPELHPCLLLPCAVSLCCSRGGEFRKGFRHTLGAGYAIGVELDQPWSSAGASAARGKSVEEHLARILCSFCGNCRSHQRGTWRVGFWA